MQSFKNIWCIYNPSSGVAQPTIDVIAGYAQKSQAHWEIRVTINPNDMTRFAQDAINAEADCIVVAGGDGTHVAVASVLYQTSIPVLFLPTGSANVLSKELHVSPTITESLDALLNTQYTLQTIDVGMINDKPFFLRVNFGLFAEMITTADQQVKNTFGSLAYGLSLAQQLPQTPTHQYEIKTPDQTVTESVVGLMVTNVGNVGMAEKSLHPDISVTDERLDILLFQQANLPNLVDIATSTLTQTAPTGLIHYPISQCTITCQEQPTILLDDDVYQTPEKTFTFSISPHKLTVVVPQSQGNVGPLVQGF